MRCVYIYVPEPVIGKAVDEGVGYHIHCNTVLLQDVKPRRKVTWDVPVQFELRYNDLEHCKYSQIEVK